VTGEGLLGRDVPVTREPAASENTILGLEHGATTGIPGMLGQPASAHPSSRPK
jgi:hypothetical protein